MPGRGLGIEVLWLQDILLFSSQSKKRRVARLKRRGKRKKYLFRNVGGMSGIPPGDWPTSKEGLKRGPTQKEKEASVWRMSPKKTKLQENCCGSTERGQEVGREPEIPERRVFAKRIFFKKATQLSGQFLRRRVVLRPYFVACCAVSTVVVKLPRRWAVVDGPRQADLWRAVVRPDVLFCRNISYFTKFFVLYSLINKRVPYYFLQILESFFPIARKNVSRS